MAMKHKDIYIYMYVKLNNLYFMDIKGPKDN